MASEPSYNAEMAGKTRRLSNQRVGCLNRGSSVSLAFFDLPVLLNDDLIDGGNRPRLRQLT